MDFGALSRRELLASTIGLLSLAAGEIKAEWQSLLDRALRSSKEAQTYVSRFYAVSVEDAKEPRDKWALWHNGQRLCFQAGGVERHFKNELKSLATTLAKQRGGNPAKLDEVIEREYKYFVAQTIDRAKEVDVDVYLDYNLWGKGEKCIGIATEKFFRDTSYQHSEDRRSYLIDNLALGKGGDQFKDPMRATIWAGLRNKEKLSDLWTYGADRDAQDYWMAVLKNRWANMQAERMLSGKRRVSDAYQSVFAIRWQKSPHFTYLVGKHQERANDKIDPQFPDLIQRGLRDSFGVAWSIKCLPVEGKVVRYDPSLMAQYKFEK